MWVSKQIILLRAEYVPEEDLGQADAWSDVEITGARWVWGQSNAIERVHQVIVNILPDEFCRVHCVSSVIDQ